MLIIILKFSLVENTKIHLFSKVEKFRKGKLCLFCKPPVWWKISGRHLLKEYGILKVLELSKTWKFKFSSNICFEKIDTFENHEARKDKIQQILLVLLPFASWKTTQRRFLTKMMAFESSEVWKISKKKFTTFLRCNFQPFWQKMKFLKVLKLERLFLK